MCTLARKLASELQQALTKEGIKTPPGKLADLVYWIDSGITKKSQLIKLTGVTDKTITGFMQPKKLEAIRKILELYNAQTKTMISNASKNPESFSMEGINLPDVNITGSAGTLAKVTAWKEGATFGADGTFQKIETKERVMDKKRYKDWTTAAELVPADKWAMAHLETIFSDTTFALGFLAEYDELSIQLELSLSQSGSVVVRFDEHSNPEVITKQDDPYLKSFDGYNRYIEMHYENMALTRFKQELDKSPDLNRGYFVTAKNLITQGVQDDDALLIFAGWAILRYEIWRSPEHKELFNYVIDLRSGADSNFREEIYHAIERNRTVSLGGKKHG